MILYRFADVVDWVWEEMRTVFHAHWKASLTSLNIDVRKYFVHKFWNVAA